MGVKVGKDTYLTGVGDTSGASRKPDALNWASERNALEPERLTRMQRQAMVHGTECHIYNTSPFFKWERVVKGHGIFTITPRAEDKQVSSPCTIPHSLRTPFDRGDNKLGSYVEDGIEIAESIVGCSKDFPTALQVPTNNLINWGVFITYGKLLEELPQEEQISLITEAEIKHSARCQDMVAKGNDLYVSHHGEWLTTVHRNAAKFCIQLGIYEEKDIPWANRTMSTAAERLANQVAMQECPSCGTEFKSKAVQCPNCKFVTDQERYDKLHVKKV